MAISSLSATIIPSPTLFSSLSSHSSKPKLLPFSGLSSTALKLKPLQFSLPTTRVYVAPEVLDSSDTIEPPPEILEGSGVATLEGEDFEVPGTSALGIGEDVDKLAPKQKIRIKLRSYWVPLIEDSCKQIMDAARNTNAKTMGPVPLPTKKRIYCVLKSPHVHKDARFHFEIRTHQRLIDILYPTAQTIDSLMQLDLPAGVDVEVKL
ncbi:30S ribosomal protein S10, chloroplastic [Benincasa hispida]|uniref:30S ribosomal protein S10, chloroplastic n=1 Tax=Benincasa hispida TaxID=102211 RepID=UPI0018FFC19B|nr:30S ribosomal protein S10, chloroplastic [Benincasa hispida]XP_038899556.1 30S ribosomal protein S10, chloroplastic [Benincasa hispida]